VVVGARALPVARDLEGVETCRKWEKSDNRGEDIVSVVV